MKGRELVGLATVTLRIWDDSDRSLEESEEFVREGLAARLNFAPRLIQVTLVPPLIVEVVPDE